MARTPSKLAEYRRKRDFSKTSEPAGAAPRATGARPLRFVVQKHDASRLHFDLRLELDGVMKSWAVPRGPSTDPAQRRLAMHVEDHPMEYNSFEGIIPEGEYGGGTVMLWDRGTYVPNGDDAADGVDAVRRGYQKGRLKIAFRGKRLRGGYVLVRIRTRDDDDQRSWLLIKERDEHADPDRDLVQEATTSIATHRSMEQIASGRSRRWSSNRDRTDDPDKTRRATKRRKAGREKSGTRRTKSGGPRAKTGNRPAEKSASQRARKGAQRTRRGSRRA